MLDTGQSAIIVVDGGCVVGIVTEYDMLRLLRQQVPPEQAVAAVMTHPVHCALADTDFREAYRDAARLGIRHIVVISASGEALGLVSEADLRRHLRPGFFSRINQVDGLMEHLFPRLPAEAPLERALAEMEAVHGSCVVVVDGRMPLGIVTERDVLKLYSAGRRDEKLGEIMSKPALAVRDDVPLGKAAHLMQERNVRHLVVVDAEGRLLGLLSEHAMLRLLRLDLIDEVQHENLDLLRSQDETREYSARTERYQQALLDNFPFLVWLKDTDSRLLAVNRAFAEATGRSRPSEVIGRYDGDLWPREIAERNRGSDLRVMREGQPAVLSEPMALDGHLAWFETYKAPVFGEAGELLGTVGFSQDVSRKRRAEEAMVLRNATLAGLIRGEPLIGILELLIVSLEAELPDWHCSILTADESGKFLSHAASPRLSDAFRAALPAIPIQEGACACGTAAALRQRIVTEDIAHDALWSDYRDKAAELGLGAVCTEPIIGTDGRLLGTFAAYHATPGRLNDEQLGKLTQASQLAALILSHQRNTVALQNSLDTFRGIFDSVGEALFIQGMDGRFLDANRGAEQMLGCAREAIVEGGHANFGAAGLNDLAAVDAHIAAAFAGQAQRFEFWLQHRAGRIFPSEVRLNRGDYFGRPVVIASVLDITDRKRAALHLEIEHDLADALAAGLSRETVLQTILQAALRFPELDAGAIYQRQSDGTFRLLAHEGLSDGFLREHRAFPADSLQARVIQAGKLICSSTDAGHPAHEGLIATPRLIGEGLRCLSILPVLIAGQAVACLYLAGRQVEQISQETLLALQTLAGNFAQTLLRLDAQEEAGRLQHNLGGLFNTLTDFLFVLDERGNILHYNRAVADNLGYGPEALKGRSFDRLAPAACQDAAVRQLVEILAGRLAGSDLPLCRADGGTVNAAARFVAGYWDGRPARFVIAQDISEQLIAEERQKLAASVFDNAHEGIMITDAEARIVEVNGTFSDLTGYARDEALGRKASLLKSGHHPAAFYQTMWETIRERGYWRGEVWNRKKSGEIFVEQLTISTVRNRAGDISNFVGVFSDITLLKEHQQRLERLAHFDALTQLPNRMLLGDRMQLAMAQAERNGKMLAVCYLDLDGFKPVNDRYGHAIGDRLLIDVAQRLKLCIRAGDTVSRLGGDEFVLLFSDLDDVHECDRAIVRVIGQLTAPFRIGEHDISISASIGVTLYPQDGADSDTLLRHADQAMYAAKQAGRNRYQLFDPENDRRARDHRERASRIRQALDKREFVLFYQPKVDMRQGRVVGAEALIRWQHPELGLLQPADFLPTIEGSELSITLGDWVLAQALDQLAAWHRQGLPLSVSVNIAGNHLLSPGFAARLEVLLADHPEVPPACLELEVLETAALEDIASVARLFAQCRCYGVKFSLDDFGTGYSSLTYFRRLPADVLKIDQSFVRDMLDDPDDLAIVEGVIGLTQAFQRKVIAEGVETAEHGMVLLQLGCDMAQGYGIARPMPAADFPAWVSRFRPEALWSSITTFRWLREDLPLLIAEAEHRHWLSRLDDWLADERGQCTAPSTDEQHCRFGRWLGSEQSNVYRRLGGFAELESCHEEFHRLGALLVTEGKRSAERTCRRAELDKLNERMCRLLQQIQSEILVSRQEG